MHLQSLLSKLSTENISPSEFDIEKFLMICFSPLHGFATRRKKWLAKPIAKRQI